MFNGPLSRTTRVSRYQKGKTSLDLLVQETVSGSGIGWAICKSVPCPRQITMPAPQHSVFYSQDALPANQPTASKHWRKLIMSSNCKNIFQASRRSQLFNRCLVIRYIKLYHSKITKTYQFLVSSLELKTCLFIKSTSQQQYKNNNRKLRTSVKYFINNNS